MLLQGTPGSGFTVSLTPFVCLFLSTAMDAIVDVDPAPMMGDVLNGFPLAVNMRLEITLLSSILSKSNLE